MVIGSTAERVVIIGAGQAGLQTALSLRQGGFAGAITMINDEAEPPYQRPPLSKAYLANKQQAEHLHLRPISFYRDHDIALMSTRRAVAIDRQLLRVALDSGPEVAYDRLILATGARPRVLPILGAHGPGVLYLRTLADATALRQTLKTARRLAVVGGGFIGLEVAAIAALAGVEVTVVEAFDRTMARIVSPSISQYFEAFHAQAGVQIRQSATATQIVRDSDRRVSGLELTDGDTVPADVIVVGVGVIANDALAASAGLPVEDGIVVNEFLQTSDPTIFAIGDCASFPQTRTNTRLRLESIQNATNHARCVAAGMIGEPQPYADVPWFWTEQYGQRLQIAGIGNSPDDVSVVLKSDNTGAFSILHFSDGGLTMAESVNRPSDHMSARRILVKDAASLTPEEAARPDFDLKKFAAAGG